MIDRVAVIRNADKEADCFILQKSDFGHAHIHDQLVASVYLPEIIPRQRLEYREVAVQLDNHIVDPVDDQVVILICRAFYAIALLLEFPEALFISFIFVVLLQRVKMIGGVMLGNGESVVRKLPEVVRLVVGFARIGRSVKKIDFEPVLLPEGTVHRLYDFSKALVLAKLYRFIKQEPGGVVVVRTFIKAKISRIVTRICGDSKSPHRFAAFVNQKFIQREIFGERMRPQQEFLC